jgi:alpha-glucosidase
VGERAVDILTLHIFPGEGESVLYEDDGESLAYQKGAFRVTRLAARQDGEDVTIDRSAAGPYEPGYTRVELVVHGVSGGAVTADGKIVQGAAHHGSTRTLRCRAPLATRYVIGRAGEQ